MQIVKVQIKALGDVHKCKMLCLVVKMICEANAVHVWPVACMWSSHDFHLNFYEFKTLFKCSI